VTGWNPDGIVVSDAFRAYVERLRNRHPVDVELAEKYGFPTGNGRFRSHMNHTESGSYGGSA